MNRARIFGAEQGISALECVAVTSVRAVDG